LLDASCFVDVIQKRQGLYVACIEEIAYSEKFINKKQLLSLANNLSKTEYGEYLKSLVENKK